MKNIALLLSFLVFANATGETADPVVFDENAERIMEFTLSDGLPLSDAVPIFPVANDWYFPLGTLADSLGIALQVSPALSQAKGTILQPGREIELDVRACTILIEDQKKSYDCRATYVYGEDIYVRKAELEQWLPIDLKVNLFRSQVVVESREPLPAQQRRAREQSARSGMGHSFNHDPGFPRVPTPFTTVDGLFVDEQIGLSRNTDGGRDAWSMRHNTRFGGEFLGLESSLFFGGDQEQIDGTRFTLSRRSDERVLFGPLGLRQVQLWDVDLPRLALLTPGSSGRGFLVSNFPLQFPTTFEATDIQGPLPNGWEVLLYSNDVLLDRQFARPDGRYLFRAVPLLYGNNIFRLSFFGPYGQQRDEYRVFQISPDLIQQGPGNFRLGMAYTSDYRQRLTMEYSKNVGRYFTASTAFLHDKGTPNTYGLFGITGVNEVFLFSAFCALSAQQGKACEWFTQFGMGGYTRGSVRYTKLFGFKSDLFQSIELQDHQVTVSLLQLIPTTPGIAMNWELVRNGFVYTQPRDSIRNRTTAALGRWQLNNELAYATGALATLDGRFDLIYLPSSSRIRFGTLYDAKKLKGFDFDYQYTPLSNYNFGVGADYQIRSQTGGLRVSASRLLKEVSIGIETGYRDNLNYFAGILLNFSAAFDSTESDWHFSRFQQAQFGGAAVNVFVDENRNGMREPSEMGVPRAGLVVNQQDGLHHADDRGHVFVPALPPFFPSDLSVSLQTLNDPYLRTSTSGARIAPRPGKTAHIDLPLVIGGGIDGYVLVRSPKGEEKPVAGMRIEMQRLGDPKLYTAKSDREGFYYFDDVAPGTYRLSVAKESLASRNMRLAAAPQEMVIPKEGAFLSEQNFTLDPP